MKRLHGCCDLSSRLLTMQETKFAWLSIRGLIASGRKQHRAFYRTYNNGWRHESLTPNREELLLATKSLHIRFREGRRKRLIEGSKEAVLSRLKGLSTIFTDHWKCIEYRSPCKASQQQCSPHQSQLPICISIEHTAPLAAGALAGITTL